MLSHLSAHVWYTGFLGFYPLTTSSYHYLLSLTWEEWHSKRKLTTPSAWPFWWLDTRHKEVYFLSKKVIESNVMVLVRRPFGMLSSKQWLLPSVVLPSSISLGRFPCGTQMEMDSVEPHAGVLYSQARKRCASLLPTAHWPGLSRTAPPNCAKHWQMELGHVPWREKKAVLVNHVFMSTTDLIVS